MPKFILEPQCPLIVSSGVEHNGSASLFLNTIQIAYIDTIDGRLHRSHLTEFESILLKAKDITVENNRIALD